MEAVRPDKGVHPPDRRHSITTTKTKARIHIDNRGSTLKIFTWINVQSKD